MTHRFGPYWIAAAVVILDRLSKLLIEARVSPWDSFTVIPGFFSIIHAENPGAAFSLFADSSTEFRSLVLVGLSVAVAVFISVLLWQPTRRGLNDNWTSRLALALVLGGAVGNLYDRVFRGTVTDFLEFYIGHYHWPTFNVADSAISIGACLLLYDMWRSRKRSAPRIDGASQGVRTTH